MKKNKIQMIVFLLVFVVLFLLYYNSKAIGHFFNHFFIGISTGILILVILALNKKNTVKYEWWIPLSTWIYAIIPEVITNEGVHPTWTNIFLFHVWFDHLLEKSLFILLILFLICIGLMMIYLNIRKRIIK